MYPEDESSVTVGSLDFEFGGATMVYSGWTGADFTGAQTFIQAMQNNGQVTNFVNTGNGWRWGGDAFSASPLYMQLTRTDLIAGTTIDVDIQSTTASTSTTTGALKVAGGLGVDGSIYANGLQITGSTLTSGAFNSFRSLTSGGAAAIQTNGQLINVSLSSVCSSLLNAPRIDANMLNYTGTPISVAGNRCRIYQFDAASRTTAGAITGYADFHSNMDLDQDNGVGGSVSITNYYGYYYQNQTNALGAGVSIDNIYGIYIEEPTRGSTINRAIHVSGGDSFFNGINILGSFSSAPTGSAGQIYYDTTTNKHRGHDGTIWNELY